MEGVAEFSRSTTIALVSDGCLHVPSAPCRRAVLGLRRVIVYPDSHCSNPGATECATHPSGRASSSSGCGSVSAGIHNHSKRRGGSKRREAEAGQRRRHADHDRKSCRGRHEGQRDRAAEDLWCQHPPSRVSWPTGRKAPAEERFLPTGRQAHRRGAHAAQPPTTAFGVPQRLRVRTRGQEAAGRSRPSCRCNALCWLPQRYRNDVVGCLMIMANETYLPTVIQDDERHRRPCYRGSFL